MRTLVGTGMGIALLSALSACAAEGPLPAPESAPVGGLQSVVEAALDDAARRSGISRKDIKVVKAGSVTWSDSSLGCPQPGVAYTQALVTGYRVELRAGGQQLDYHAALRGPPALCPAGRAVEPMPSGAAE
jgi:predicted small lipoprotein YifL